MRVLPAPAGTVVEAGRQDSRGKEVTEKNSDQHMIATAIGAHAAAILELAQAIREHTQSQFLVEDDSDEDESPRFYMDGTPVQ